MQLICEKQNLAKSEAPTGIRFNTKSPDRSFLTGFKFWRFVFQAFLRFALSYSLSFPNFG